MKRCSAKAFNVGCVEHHGDDISVQKQHGVYCVRGFDRRGAHVNRCFRTVGKARTAAGQARRGVLTTRY